MKKFVLMPDSFKGTMSSAEICDIAKREILKIYPKAEVISVPVADGGEGTVECFLQALGGKRVSCTVQGPFAQDMESFYGLLGDGKTAAVEMAACAGLPLVRDNKNPLTATTYGVGELILDACKSGARRIVTGLGGSATNDGGCGAAAAAGVKFYDKDGNAFVPTGGTLREIDRISAQGRSPLLDGVEIVTMCDIDNPLYGPNGAAHIFGPQKGADEETVRLLDQGLIHLCEIIRRDLKLDLSEIPGGGAAGGMGAGMTAFFGSKLQMGIDAVLDTVNFEKLIENADMIITGEGRIDRQSLRGKVVIGVSRRAKPAKIPVVAIVGDIGDDVDDAYGEGVSAIFSINRVAVDFKAARPRAKDDFALTVYNLMHFLAGLKK